MSKKLLNYGMAVLLAFGLASCSDDSDVSSHGEDIEWGSNPEMPPEGWTAALMPAMATDIDVPNGGTAKLKVSLISLEEKTVGEGLYGEKISWGIESGESLISLPAKSSITSDNGLTSINVQAKKEVGEAIVVALSPKAPKTVRFKLNILDRPMGDLSVKTFYNGYAPVVDYAIKLYDGTEVQCAFIDLKTGVDADIEPLGVAEGNAAFFEDLPTEQRYSVVAYGYAQNGAPVAAGCLDSGLTIIENDTAEGTVYLDTIDLDPSTTYHARSIFDLGDITSALGSVGKFIVKVTDFADNPAQTMYDLLWDYVLKKYLGGIGDAAEWLLDKFGLEDKLVKYLNDLLKQNKTVCKVGMFGCQLRNFVRTMEFMGELDMHREGSVVLAGHNVYNGLAVYWRLNCDPSDSNCGRMPLTMHDVGLADNNFLEGSWDGSLANGYDKISIEPHELKLSYGKIVMYLINHVLLPKLANGATDFSSALAYWVGCDSIAAWLADALTFDVEVLWGIGGHISNTVTTSQAKGWCTTAIGGLSTLLNFVAAWGELQNAGADIKIAGTARLVDTNADNLVDDIIGGTWTGSMTVKTKDEAGASVSATTGINGLWSAYNNDNIEVEGSMYCSSPKPSNAASDQSCGYPDVNLEDLLKSTMCAEYQKCM